MSLFLLLVVVVVVHVPLGCRALKPHLVFFLADVRRRFILSQTYLDFPVQVARVPDRAMPCTRTLSDWGDCVVACCHITTGLRVC